MKLFEIDQQTCNKDGICAAVCPLKIIAFKEGECPTPVSGAEKVCVRCGHCVTVCPTGSFSHSEMPVEQCPPVRDDLQLTAEQCEHFLRSRRSIRVYKNKPVPRDTLLKLIEIAGYAPSGHNSQCVEWLVIEDSDELYKLKELVLDWMRWMISNKPAVASTLQLNESLKQWKRGSDVILRDAPVLIIAHAEKGNIFAPAACTIALAYLELAATSMGLGACWTGFFFSAATSFPPLKEALALPEGHQCFGTMIAGYPKFQYQRIPLRKSPVVTVTRP